MSFAKIAEARAVKKIVALIRQIADNAKASGDAGDPWAIGADELLEDVASRIEDGMWKGVVLPKPKKKAKKK